MLPNMLIINFPNEQSGLIGIATSFSSWINEHPKDGFSHINYEK